MTLLKHAIRQLMLHPGIAGIVIVMLALGIGSATAIFALFHQVLVQPLPVPAPERLVNIEFSQGEALSYPMFRDLEADQDILTGIGAYTPFTANVLLGEAPHRVSGAFVTGGYFEVLGLGPALGRLIGREDDARLGESAVVVLSHAFWRSRFGGDSNVVGRVLNVNGRPLTIVGVAPEMFSGTRLGLRTEVFVPVAMRWELLGRFVGPDSASNRGFRWMFAFGRLPAGVSIDEASAGLDTLYRRILAEIEAPLRSSDDERRELLAQRLELLPGARGQGSIAGAGGSLTLLLGLTLLVLLIVCVNVANLLLVRGAARAGEMAVRESLGASRGRLVAELLIESAVPAAIGGLLALPVASLILAGTTAVLPPNLAAGLTMTLGSTAVSFAVLATIAAAALFGVFPALRSARIEPAVAMKGQSAHALGGHAAPRVRAALVTVQIAFSLVLLVLAGLFARSLLNVARIDLGIDVDSLVTFSVAPDPNAYEPEEASVLYRRIEEAIAAQPGVVDVATAFVPVLAGNEFDATFPLELSDGMEEPVSASFNVVSESFFRTVGIDLLEGRGFAEAAGSVAAIVNEQFVRRYRLGDDAIGTRVMLEDRVEIVGVVADAAYSEIKGEVPPQLFVPRGAIDLTAFAGSAAPTFYVHTTVDPDVLLQTIPPVIAEIDPALPVDGLKTLRRQARERVFVDRLVAMLSSGFAALATLLAAIGLYGIISYNVAARTRELAVRLAVGARPGGLRWMVMRQVVGMAAIGLSIGLVAAIGLGRAAEGLLFGLSGRDPLVLAAGVAVLGAVVLAASFIPARRASAVAPMEALRHE
ncbi:MAG: ABC transporter permease [Gammaproteobacteria bacterium]|nr:ABC transporter permease [Gammaproteobacteria bacterium]